MCPASPPAPEGALGGGYLQTMGDIASPDHDTPAHLAGHVDDITAASSSSRLLSGATERSSASGGSTPDQEGYVENDHEPEPEREPGPDQPLENRQQQKRKGGRKPVSVLCLV